MNTSTVFGIHAVRSLLQRAPARLRKLIIDSRREDARIRELLQLAQTAGLKVERADAKAIAGRVGDVAHQGVIAEVEALPAWQEADLLQALTGQPNPLVLLLDGVQDPHNLGACLRTADACGALAVVVPKDRAAGMNATVRKVAAGAADTTPLVSVTNLARSMKLLKEAGLWIAGADMT
ncbi:MAG TPA: TrmH family RNA methyltransferase, partial [Steroidobacteraceae bacterium]|nr:TrmH family RNA methyltransferase [Steroidobacteraceae bacterium]